MKKTAFSLVELMIALIIISILSVAFIPVMTKKSSQTITVAGQNDSIPVGGMIYWLGTNFPSNWMLVKGQDITGEEFSELRKALGGNIEKLPDFNMYEIKDDSLVMIIKYTKKASNTKSPQNINKNSNTEQNKENIRQKEETQHPRYDNYDENNII